MSYQFNYLSTVKELYKPGLVEEFGSTCALKTVGAFNASTSQYIPFRPLKVCPILKVISSRVVQRLQWYVAPSFKNLHNSFSSSKSGDNDRGWLLKMIQLGLKRFSLSANGANDYFTGDTREFQAKRSPG